MRKTLLLILALSLFGCKSEQQIAARDAEYSREAGIEDAANYREYVEGYAKGLGKTPDQLTPAERARMEQLYR
jgi:hypothetical protein